MEKTDANTLQDHYHSGIDALEELKSLVDRDLIQFVDQAIFHMLELKEKAPSHQQSNLQEYTSLLDLMVFRIQDMIKESCKSFDYVSNFSLHYGPQKIHLNTWNKILTFLPSLFQLGKILKFKNQLMININNEQIELVSFINTDDWEDEFKAKTYKLTRFFLQHQALLTYNIADITSKSQQLFKIHIKLDFSHNQNSCYALDFKETHGVTMAMSNAFAQYILPQQSLHTLGQHICLELTENLNIERYNKIPYEFHNLDTSLLKSRAVLYFPFLFRPISLIIPKGGQLIPIEKNSLLQTPTDETGIHTYQYSPSHTFIYLDFFSLIAR